jgi:hypothetical protein
MDDGYWDSIEASAPPSEAEDTQFHWEEPVVLPTRASLEYAELRKQVDGVYAEAQEGHDAFVDFRPVFLDPDEPPPPPPTEMVIHNREHDAVGALFSRGLTYCVFGPPAAGKSWLAMALAGDFRQKGERTLWFDADGMNRPRTTARLTKQFGYTKKCLQDDKLFVYFPARMMLEQDHSRIAAHFEELAREWQPSLIVWDSWGRALSAFGLDENSTDEVNTWWSMTVDAMHKACPDAVIVLVDHVSKDAMSGGTRKSPLGSQRKQSAPDALLCMGADGEKQGMFYIDATKDRDGVWDTWTQEGLRFELESQGGYWLSTKMTTREKQEAAEESDFIAGAFALHSLTTGDNAGKSVSKSRWRVAITGVRNERRTHVIDTLIESGVALEADIKNGHISYRWAKPYESPSTPLPTPEKSDTHALTSDSSEDDQEFPF